MARVPQRPVDPVRDAAAILRRVGAFALIGAMPLAGLAGRGGATILLVIGAALVAVASFLDRAARPLRLSVGDALSSSLFLAFAAFVAWSALSLLWTPFPGAAASRFAGLAGLAVVTIVACLALPDRSRAANLYLLPFGVAIAGVAALVLAISSPPAAGPEAARRLERGLSILVLCAWPAFAWLQSRGRDVPALALAALVGAVSLFGPGFTPAIAFAAGALAYLVVLATGGTGAAVIGLFLGAVLLLAPGWLALIPAGARTTGGLVADWAAGLAAWKPLLLREPVRLLTGHGLGSLRAIGSWVGAPAGSPALALWFELGVVGVAAASAILWRAVDRDGSEASPLRPGIAASAATFAVLAFTGVDRGDDWLLASLAAILLFFIAAGRGQFRTRRPRAFGFDRVRTA